MGNKHNANVWAFGIITLFFEYTSPELGIILDTGSVELLHRAGEGRKVIDEGVVICEVGEPDRTVFLRVMHSRAYSSKPNRVLISLVP